MQIWLTTLETLFPEPLRWRRNISAAFLEARKSEAPDEELLSARLMRCAAFMNAYGTYAFQSALIEVFKVISRAKKYIDGDGSMGSARMKPIPLALPACCTTFWKQSVLRPFTAFPFMPDSCETSGKQIGRSRRALPGRGRKIRPYAAGCKGIKGEVHIPRIDLKRNCRLLKRNFGKKRSPGARAGSGTKERRRAHFHRRF
jgi:methionyl-tRNA synthetase